MRVSVVIPTVNRRDSVLRTVSTVLSQDFPASDCEIIIVADGASDDTAEALRRCHTESRVRVLEFETNRGPAAARTAGWCAAAGELVVFLDDDLICTPGLLRAHVAAHIGVGNREIVGLGAIYVSPKHPPSLASELFRRGLGAEYQRRRLDPDEPWPENVWSFANTSVARAVLERVGGFDERFRKREDCELGVRLLEAGVQQQFLGAAVAYQSCDKSAQQLVRDAEVFAECDLLFLRAHPGSSPHDFLSRLQREGPWKRRARQMLARHLTAVELVLVPLCTMGEWHGTPGPLRSVAARSLQFRCGLHWYHRLLEVSGTQPEDWIRGDH
jgi:glycosyltransferase involved in cell wall biosynthesis